MKAETIMISNILFAGLIVIGIGLFFVYNYIAIWRIPREAENREKLGWYSMLCVSTAVFALLVAWRIREPLAKDFLPVFFIFSLILGFLARESATSPYKLAEYWKRLATKRGKDHKKKAG